MASTDHVTRGAETAHALTLSISRSSMPLRSSSPSPQASATGKHSSGVIWGQVLVTKRTHPLGHLRTRGLWPRVYGSPSWPAGPAPLRWTGRRSQPSAMCGKGDEAEPRRRRPHQCLWGRRRLQRRRGVVGSPQAPSAPPLLPQLGQQTAQSARPRTRGSPCPLRPRSPVVLCWVLLGLPTPRGPRFALWPRP